MATGTASDAATRLRDHLGPLVDLRGVLSLLNFDQETVMPASGAAARRQQEATVRTILHERLISDELLELLDEAEAEGADGDDAALIRVVRRDALKSRKVPTELVTAMTLAANRGQEAWVKARQESDFAAFLPFLERNIELRREYAACFAPLDAYDALLDDYEEGLRTEDVAGTFGPLREQLPALVAAASERSPGPLKGPFSIEGQRAALDLLLRRIGFSEESWVLADSVHPFSATPGHGDNRITTRFSETNLESMLSGLHEFGHGLYEAQVDAAFARSPIGTGVSMSVHESQSRLWEIFVGGSVPFWRGWWDEFTTALGGAPDGLDVQGFVTGLMSVQPSLIRVDADPVSYPLHIVLRFDLELALMHGDLAPADLPGAWNDGIRDLLGIEVPEDRLGVLQDVHWSFGAFGYFPTYGLGTLLAAQLWACLREDLPDLDASLEAGDCAPLREWLAEKVHRHGKRLTPKELVRSATGRDLDAGPYLDYARARAGLD